MLLRQWSVHRQFVFPCSVTCSLTPGCILDAHVIPIKYYMCPSVTVHLVGGILDEVQHDILDESLLGHWSTQSMAPLSITTPHRLRYLLVTSTWSLCLRMDFDFEILSSKMEVGADASSYFNTSFRLIALVLINAVTLAYINPESHYSIGSTPRCFLPSFVVITFILIVW